MGPAPQFDLAAPRVGYPSELVVAGQDDYALYYAKDYGNDKFTMRPRCEMVIVRLTGVGQYAPSVLER